MLAEWRGCQVESHLFATFTVPIGEMHEDFETLKEEIQRETRALETLSRVGQSSLLTSLSKLLGKKGELQDLELTVRSPWKRGGCGRREVLGAGAAGGGSDMAEGGQWPGDSTADAFPKAGQVPPRLPDHSYSLVPLEKGKQCRFPQGPCSFPMDRGR